MWQRNTLFKLSALSLTFIQSFYVYGENQPTPDAINIERIVVTSSMEQLNNSYIAYDQAKTSDLSDWLTSIPGANVNKNGPIVGIAQYRGLYGDRVSVNVDGQPIIGAGPNAMDTPLSYAANITSDSLTLYRGIAPVSAGIETLGGAIDVNTQSIELNDSKKWTANGSINAAYANNSDANKVSTFTNIANQAFGALVYVDFHQGDDIETASGKTITPTKYNKTQAGLETKWQQSEESILGLTYDYTDTQDSGTPALPMDITYIFTHRVGLTGSHDFTSSQLNWSLGYTDADHEMDNFNNRPNNNMSGFRTNNADSESYSYNIHWQNDNWLVGADGIYADHNATITNPNNTMFEVKNFNDVEEAKHSLFVQYHNKATEHGVNFGARVKHISADAGDVSHHMAMMNPAVGDLVNDFNNSDRSQSSIDIDLTFEYKNQLTPHTLLSFAAARKERAPSYQERYLWIPMEATGGLADGNTYLGDVNLSSETAYQTNLGLTYQTKTWQVLADMHYQYIDDYIQGVPSQNMQAIMIANMMMNNDTVLQYDNVEASLYGAETLIIYHLSSAWQTSLQASYVRGKREDISDNLYRVAPLTAAWAISYQQESYLAEIKLHAVAEQDKVSNTNKEQTTPGYGYLDLQFAYTPTSQITLKAGISNLLDKDYQNHLSGYNRVNHSEIDVMERFPSAGRDIWLAVDYDF